MKPPKDYDKGRSLDGAPLPQELLRRFDVEWKFLSSYGLQTIHFVKDIFKKIMPAFEDLDDMCHVSLPVNGRPSSQQPVALTAWGARVYKPEQWPQKMKGLERRNQVNALVFPQGNLSASQPLSSQMLAGP